jgi:UDP:flavonoid glycosyltransferase YjiC (YdhE family)
MRFLFVTWAWRSHFHAMVPAALACRAAGHEVLVSSQPGLVEEITGVGLTADAVGTDVDALTTFREIARPNTPRTGRPDGRGRGGARVLDLQTALAEDMVDDLIAVCDRWSPDLLVFEPTALAGPTAAVVCGVPAVRHLYGTDLMSTVGPWLGPALEPLCERLELDEVDPFGLATVDPWPAPLQFPPAPRRRPDVHRRRAHNVRACFVSYFGRPEPLPLRPTPTLAPLLGRH